MLQVLQTILLTFGHFSLLQVRQDDDIFVSIIEAFQTGVTKIASSHESRDFSNGIEMASGFIMAGIIQVDSFLPSGSVIVCIYDSLIHMSSENIHIYIESLFEFGNVSQRAGTVHGESGQFLILFGLLLLQTVLTVCVTILMFL